MSSTTTPATALSLPLSLLLLVHLHLLRYPNANDAEYDHDLFNVRKRGLRERVKTMEDVGYFLVGKMEKKGVKSILSTYPCRQPSESVAFRTSLTKYLEQLRHKSIYPPKAGDGAPGVVVAPWWKDAVVRKSLIEECSGDKFERMIVSLSTHALMVITRSIPSETLTSLLHAQPISYTNALARYQSVRHGWMRSSSIVLRRERDFHRIRSEVETQDRSSLVYRDLPTSRLKALSGSKLQDVKTRHWSSDEARSALAFLIELAGLDVQSRNPNGGSEMLPYADQASTTTVQPSPLPVAAAHHPTHLKKLKRSVFYQATPPADMSASSAAPVAFHAEIVLANLVQHLKRTRQALNDSLARCRKRTADLRHILNGVLAQSTTGRQHGFWVPEQGGIDLIYEPIPNRELLVTLGLAKEFDDLNPATEGDEQLENRINEIRTGVLVPRPSPPDVDTPRLPPREAIAPKSRIPQIKPNATAAKVTIATPVVPQTPAISPSKSSWSLRRKSVRFSSARRRTGRPSMFQAFNALDDEVDRLVEQTHDFPTDDENTDHEGPLASSPLKTPKGKRKVNRIWTAGTPASKNRGGGATPRARESVALTKLFEVEPMRLPTLGSSTSSSLFEDDFPDPDEGVGLEGEDEDEEGDFRDREAEADATPMPKRKGWQRYRQVGGLDEEDGMRDVDEEEEEEDIFGDDPPSMTLKDLLLSADTSQFDLLDQGSEDLENDMLEEDSSFVWE